MQRSGGGTTHDHGIQDQQEAPLLESREYRDSIVGVGDELRDVCEREDFIGLCGF